MSENVSTGLRTRHVDTRYHFIRENVADGFIIDQLFISEVNSMINIEKGSINIASSLGRIVEFLTKVRNSFSNNNSLLTSHLFLILHCPIITTY